MGNFENLHAIRDAEYRDTVRHFAAGAAILEVGGGTGYQAKCLARDGFRVVSIDVPSSNYAAHQEFPVQPYDGRTFPFPDASFDIVFTSNVLEHVHDLGRLHGEVRRVLRPGGYCIHIMPSATWRLWTALAHYIDLGKALAAALPRLAPRGMSAAAVRASMQGLRHIAGLLRYRLLVPRHGEHGSALGEVLSFSRWRWERHFRHHGFDVALIQPMGIFYTGHAVLGNRLPLDRRRALAGLLGSACILYKIVPAGRHP